MFTEYVAPIKRQKKIKLLTFTRGGTAEGTINDVGLGVNARQSVL